MFPTELKKLEMETCYFSNPDCHYIDYEANLKSDLFNTSQIIKIMMKFNKNMTDEFKKHFIIQIIKNEKIINKYFTSDEIIKINNIILIK